MKTLRPQYPLTVMCRVFDVSRSGYHAFFSRTPSKRARENARLEVAIQAAHVRTRETYGPGRLQDELHDDGVKAGVSRIKRLRKKLGLRCKQVRKFKVTTNSNHDLPVAPNLLNQKFDATHPNETWVTDITYVPTAEGWLYLSGVKDLHTRELVGHAMGARMTKDLVGRALVKAVRAKRPTPGLIHHSDRGATATTMRRWRASGARSRTNWCTTGVTKPESRLDTRSPSTLRYSTTVSGGIRSSAISHRRRLLNGFTGSSRQHDVAIHGVHY